MNKYKSTASYKRTNPKTGDIETTSRFVEMFAANRRGVEAELMKQVKLDNPVGKVSIETKKLR